MSVHTEKSTEEVTASRLQATGLSVGYGERSVIEDLDLQIESAKITTIIGPNGCGKSTLLRSMARLLKPTAGQVVLDGTDIATQRTKDVARTLGLLPQSPEAPDGLTVSDLVSRGRHPHQAWYRQWSRDDAAAVDEALVLTNTDHLADRGIDALSGGQRQRVWMAMVLAQQTDLVMLDEPTTYLDLAHAVEVLELVTRLRSERSKTVVMVLHDLNLAVRYSDQVVVMRDGKILASGAPGTIVTEDMLREAFDLNARVIEDPVFGCPLIIPIGRPARD
ncbi:ABC transporter ATP-binding protein [Williamsia sterculiae]|uniref:Iron complex transport system ATP-binding protein n=1 Tax=Williamsia sterculiae TaxID=1344003 RepID=A0A1N7CQ39_9NOCA|nr:ABC transporter ATP-binding protein [Williamsia sterculiae]SIR65729.1 iron complex transport system ATP-binding protein [Williamsia sterculiae]